MVVACHDYPVVTGTTSPTSKLHINHITTTNDPSLGGLYLYNPTNSGGQNSFITNRIGGSLTGKVVYSFDVNGTYGYSIKMNENSSALRFNNDWAGSGTDNMIINNNGYIAIGAVSGSTPAYRCHIKCNYGDITGSLHLDASDSTDPNRYALSIYPCVVGGGQVGWRFRTQSYDGGTTTPLEFRQNGEIRVMVDRWMSDTNGVLRLYFESGTN